MPTTAAEAGDAAGSVVPARRLWLAGLGLTAAGGWVVWRSLKRAAALPPADTAAGGAPMPLRSVTEVNDTTPLPDFRLRSPVGPITPADLRGRWSMVFFGYTHCPDVCPTTLGMMAEVVKQLPQAERPLVLFVSVDPARDTPELLGSFVPVFDPTFIGASGSDEQLAALTRHLGVHYDRHQAASPGGFYTVDHTVSMFLIDPQVRLKAVFSPPHQPETVLADYRRLRG